MPNILDTKNLDVEALVKDLNEVVRKMYAEGNEIMFWGREILAVLKRHKVGE
jgi:hypothetical protein